MLTAEKAVLCYPDCMTADQLLNNAIEGWLAVTDKLVVAIDGYTGIGKTTLVDNLALLNPNVLIVHRDDFGVSRKQMEELLKTAEDRSKVFELDNCDNKKVEDLIASFRRGNKVYSTNTYNSVSGEIDIPKDFDLTKKVLVIEGVFMLHPKLLNHLWDKRVYLDGDIAKIDERRIKREKEKWGKNYFPEDHPDSYFRQVTIALKRYTKTYKPEQIADLVLRVD